MDGWMVQTRESGHESGIGFSLNFFFFTGKIKISIKITVYIRLVMIFFFKWQHPIINYKILKIKK